MSPWPDNKIATLALRLIRKCSIPDQWRYTFLETWDARIPLTVDPNELPLVVIYFSASSWTVFTSRRIAGVFGSQSFDCSPLDVEAHDWGVNPKGIGGITSRTASLQLRDGRVVQFEFESVAWLGPLYAMMFWDRKFPVLDNLAL